MAQLVNLFRNESALILSPPSEFAVKVGGCSPVSCYINQSQGARILQLSASVGCHVLKGVSKPQPGTLEMGYRLGLQTMSISCTTWGVHSLATSSSFLGEVSRRGDSGGWFQQQRYISVVDMKGKSSMWQLVSGSSLQVSIMSLSGTDRTGTIFSGVSLLRSSLWFGEPGWSSAFWGLSLELLPRDFWTLESPKHDFLCV